MPKLSAFNFQKWIDEHKRDNGELVPIWRLTKKIGIERKRHA